MRPQYECRACKAKLDLVYTLGEQSLSAFLKPGDEIRRGPLDMMLCRDCGLAQLGHTYPGDWFYDWYGYRTGTNPMMVAALSKLADDLRPYLKVGDTILDIGSNDGTFLRNVSASEIRRIGVDPVKNLGPAAREGLHLFVNDYFTEGTVRTHVRSYGQVKVVTMLAMFYELEDPVGFLREVRSVLADDGVIVIQMNYLAAMLRQNGYDNIVHEHQTYFSLTTLVPVLEVAGFRAIDVTTNDINGGSFCVWAVPDAAKHERPGGSIRLTAMLAEEDAQGLNVSAPHLAFWRRIRDERDRLRELVAAARARGPVYVYGASTRGLAIMEFAGLDHAMIAGAAERNPDKYGRTYGGTGIVCVSEEEARAKATSMLVLAAPLPSELHPARGGMARARRDFHRSASTGPASRSRWRRGQARGGLRVTLVASAIGEVIDYSVSLHPLDREVQRALGIGDLPLYLIHRIATRDYPLFRRDNDQSSEFHRRFYARFAKDVEPAFRELVHEIIRPRYPEPIVYQRIPTFRVHLPHNVAVGEFHRDRDYDHSPSEENYWLPFTAAWGTNTIWIESAPGADDCQPVEVHHGQILKFDGANLKHGNHVNDTSYTRVSMDFRIIPKSRYQDSDRKTINTGMRFAIGGYFAEMP